jgi:hypothetical protein
MWTRRKSIEDAPGVSLIMRSISKIKINYRRTAEFCRFVMLGGSAAIKRPEFEHRTNLIKATRDKSTKMFWNKEHSVKTTATFFDFNSTPKVQQSLK